MNRYYDTNWQRIDVSSEVFEKVRERVLLFVEKARMPHYELVSIFNICFDQLTFKLKNYRDKLYCRALKSKNVADWDKYKNIRNKYNMFIKMKMKNYFFDKNFSYLNHQTNTVNFITNMSKQNHQLLHTQLNVINLFLKIKN